MNKNELIKAKEILEKCNTPERTVTFEMLITLIDILIKD